MNVRAAINHIDGIFEITLLCGVLWLIGLAVFAGCRMSPRSCVMGKVMEAAETECPFRMILESNLVEKRKVFIQKNGCEFSDRVPS
jgi:hypothetical protein